MNKLSDAFICDAVRTPFGRYGRRDLVLEVPCRMGFRPALLAAQRERIL